MGDGLSAWMTLSRPLSDVSRCEIREASRLGSAQQQRHACR
ncbi:hypothetical protein ANO14919_055260 [Xylariales sp. No.14919]|nr:hypothetical protein ANO14919_055260 [Xylariales sp. No.14919]